MYCRKTHIWSTNECQTCKARYLSRVIEDIKIFAGRKGYTDIVSMIENIDDEDYIIERK